jgi:hypothetical protein
VTPSPGLRKEWLCVGCSLRVFNACGDEIPVPHGWADERCPRCRVDHVREIEGREESVALEEKLRHASSARRRAREERDPAKPKAKRAPNSDFGERKEKVRAAHLAHPDWDRKRVAEETGIPSRTVARYWRELGLVESKGPLPNKDAIEQSLKGPIKSDRDVAAELGATYDEVNYVRKKLGIPNYTKRLHMDRQERVRAIVGEHPDWTNGQVLEAMGESHVPVGKIRRELDLPRYTAGKGQRSRPGRALPAAT